MKTKTFVLYSAIAVPENNTMQFEVTTIYDLADEAKEEIITCMMVIAWTKIELNYVNNLRSKKYFDTDLRIFLLIDVNDKFLSQLVHEWLAVWWCKNFAIFYAGR